LRQAARRLGSSAVNKPERNEFFLPKLRLYISAGIANAAGVEIVPLSAFGQFRKRFKSALDSETLGASRPNVQDFFRPAKKYIDRHELKAKLGGYRFLRRVYELKNEYFRLDVEREKAHQVARKYRPRIQRHVRYAKTLRRIERELNSLIQRMHAKGDLRTDDVTAAMEAVREASESVEREQRELTSWGLHPSSRKRHDKSARFEPLFREFQYDLPTLRDKAPEQWLWEQLYSEVYKTISAKVRNPSKQSCFTIVSVLLQQLGLGWVQPATIKEFIIRKRHQS
jgi:hypothetical protein